MSSKPYDSATPGRLGRAWNVVKTDPWWAWLASRATAIAIGLITWALNRGNVFVDITGYGRWAFDTLGGTLPYRDFNWEYPPMAMPGMLGPALVTAVLPTWRYLPYLVAWMAMVLAIDALIQRTLIARCGRDVRHPALLIWILGPALLGAESWTRFDMLAAAAAFSALIYAGTRRSTSAGLAAGIGATLKLWPSLLAPVQRTRRGAVLATAIAGATVGVVAGITWLITGTSGFSQVLAYQSDRGLQIESVAALPLVWLNHLGVEGYGTRFAYGAFEITGPGVSELADLAQVAFAVCLGLVFLAHWRLMKHDAGRRGVALTGVALMLVILVTNKVFSPQYVLWLLAVMAVAAVLDPPTWKRHVMPLLILCGLTQIVFPLFYGDVLTDAWTGLIALTARDVLVVYLLVSVAGELAREVWSTRSLKASSADAAPKSPTPLAPPS